MSKENKIKFFEGMYFYDTKTFNIFKLLADKKKSKDISDFKFNSFYNSEEGFKVFTIESITVDFFTFENGINSSSELRNDLKFFFFLNSYLKSGVINSFELLKYNSSNRKYNAKRTIVDELKFDSRQEVYFYISLLLKKSNNEIKDFSLKPKFILQESFTKVNNVNGKIKKFPTLPYIADFEVTHNNNFKEIIDVKGVLTDVFIIKRKLFEFKFPHLNLSVLKQKSESSLEFIDIDEYEAEKKKRKKAKKLAESK